MTELKESKKINKSTAVILLGILYALLLVGLTVYRCFDNNFWYDEIYTINAIKLESIPSILKNYVDAMPPLYVIMAHLVCRLLGFNEFSYHFSSVLPLLVMLAVSVTVVRKEFGARAMFIFMTLCTFSSEALYYNIEVRSYSTAAMFVFLTYLMLYFVIKKIRVWNFSLMLLFALLAVYTHYYAAFPVFFCFLAMLVWLLLKNRKLFFKILLVCLIPALLFIPQLGKFVETAKKILGSDRSDVWVAPSFPGAIAYPFCHEFIPFWLILAAMVVVLVIKFRKSGAKLELTTDNFFIITGFMIFGMTVTASFLVMLLINPAFVIRYVYPAVPCVWLAAAVICSKLKERAGKVLFIISMVFLTAVGGYCYVKAVKDSEAKMAELEKTVDLIVDEYVPKIYLEKGSLNEYIAYHYFNVSYVYSLFDEDSMPKTSEEFVLITQPGVVSERTKYLLENCEGFSLYLKDVVVGEMTIDVYKKK